MLLEKVIQLNLILNFFLVLIMTFLEDRNFENVPSIPEYYKGKTIFITGASGFMGKVLIEMLLYSCTDLDRIYLLLRSKKNDPPEERLSKIYSSHCFDRLRKEKPDAFRSKVFYIAGDIAEPGLGISDEDRTLIINRTHIIFHAAASVRFDDSLKKAAQLNLCSTIALIELATEVRNLECLVHFSTAYSNTNRDPIEEVMYPPHVNWRDMLRVCEEMDDHTLQVLTPKYIGDLPNTYVFTKQLAEHVVYEYKGKLPIVIIRPSIVISSHKDPFPGWIDNFNGPNGIVVGCGKGILRTLLSKPDQIMDYVPVDVCIKACIASSWLRGTKKLETTDDIPIYNSCAGKLKNITLQQLVDLGYVIIDNMPFQKFLWTYNVTITESLFMYNIYVLLLHLIPALFVDLLLRILGKKPMLFKIQRRVYVSNLALRYFINQQWTFCNNNLLSLRSTIKEIDKTRFFYDIETIDLNQFFTVSCTVGRKYLLNEETLDLTKAKANYRRIQILDKLLKYIFYGILFWWIVNMDFIKNIFTS